MLSGIAIFLVGSILCGFAWSMPSLIAFRLLQGVGAGAVQPTAMTIVGDLYSVHERGKIQGWLASVWATLRRPRPAGRLADHPALVMGLDLLDERADRRRRRRPASGSVCTRSVGGARDDRSCQRRRVHNRHRRGDGGDDRAFSTAGWTEIAIISAIAVVAVAAFVVQERRSPEPMISLELWGRRPIAAVNAVLAVRRHGDDRPDDLPARLRPGRDGQAAADARVSRCRRWCWAGRSGRRCRRGSGSASACATCCGPASALVPLGALAFVFLQAETPPVVAGIGSAVVGLGMGLSSSASIVLIQEIVDWSERGSVTAAYMFARTLGSTFGATVFGAVLNFGLRHAGLGAVSPDRTPPPARRLGSERGAERGARGFAAGDLRLDVRRRAARRRRPRWFRRSGSPPAARWREL